MTVLLEVDHLLPAYSSVEEAADLSGAPRDPLGTRHLFAVPPPLD